ncbi:hypothetical protein [Pseudomonas sp. 18175]|uniref:hypothetical protein n=1 Tax=Pseudomonas sp. 18175 TaxID=3390056 RepID=UPI003D248372
MLTDQSLWQLYTQALSRQAGLMPNEVFSVAAVNTFSALGSPVGDIRNWCIYLLGNGIPTPNATYAAQSGVFSAYWIYLSYLLQRAAQPPMLAFASGAAAGDFEHYRQLISARLAAPPAARATPLFKTSTDPLASAHQQLLSTLGPQAPAIAAALNQCWLASQPEKVESNMWAQMSDAAPPFLCPGYVLENWSATFATWLSHSADSPIHLVEQLSMGLPTPVQSTASVLLGSSPWPAFFQVATTVTPTLALTQPLSLSISLDMSAFGSFALSASTWLDLRFFNAEVYPLPTGAPPFLSTGGSLELLPTRAVIGFQPRLTVRASNGPLAQQLASHIRRIGPFDVTPSVRTAAVNNTSQVDLHFNAADSSVPVLLGVVCTPTAQ